MFETLYIVAAWKAEVFFAPKARLGQRLADRMPSRLAKLDITGNRRPRNFSNSEISGSVRWPVRSCKTNSPRTLVLNLSCHPRQIEAEPL